MMRKLIGPFNQIISLNHIPLRGPVRDSELEILNNGGIVLQNHQVIEMGNFNSLAKKHNGLIEEISGPSVLLPGMVDAHTHICYAGSRALDYARKLEGMTYQDILAAGGGIYHTVSQTRKSSIQGLENDTARRVNRHFHSGVTTIEIKSGYGLTMENEIKMLEVIDTLDNKLPADLIPTCLAAHVRPEEYDTDKEYLDFILRDMLPVIRERGLARRVDIFIEAHAFSPDEATYFLKSAAALGFSLTVHADQFTKGGSLVAAQCGAVSADHLEASGLEEIRAMVDGGVIATVLPGASLGLGMPFAPARKILDEGASLVIASDWNPGSAPMGDLLAESALLSMYEKLSFAETLAGITFRAANALGLSDRGIIAPGKLADLMSFHTEDYREILYNQGMLKPDKIWKKGTLYELT